MILPNPNININIKSFDDRQRQRKLAAHLKHHKGSNVSIKDLLDNDLLCDANIELLRQIKAYIHNRVTDRLYVHGYILKHINTPRGDLIIVLIRLEKVETGETFTLYPDILLPMIKFTATDIYECIQDELPDRFYHFDLEGLYRIAARINDPPVYGWISSSLSACINIIKIMFDQKSRLIHKLYPNYLNLFHTGY